MHSSVRQENDQGPGERQCAAMLTPSSGRSRKRSAGKRRSGRAASILGASCALCKPLGARRAVWGRPVGPSWVEPLWTHEGILALAMTELELGDGAGERGALLAAGEFPWFRGSRAFGAPAGLQRACLAFGCL